ncbi:MAG: hypothetical protein ACRD3B_09370 [Candidatus Sulfotelmatobacter sp.]
MNLLRVPYFIRSHPPEDTVIRVDIVVFVDVIRFDFWMEAFMYYGLRRPTG